ncbi:MAG TPA: type VI secretion system tube protein TssD [Flavobacterium sp.]|jgi:hypothetical protein
MNFISKLHFNGHELDVVEFSIEDIEQYTAFGGKQVSLPSGSKIRITVIKAHPDTMYLSSNGHVKEAEVTLYQHGAISRIKGFSFRNAYSRIYSANTISAARKIMSITIDFYTAELTMGNAWEPGRWVSLN